MHEISFIDDDIFGAAFSVVVAGCVIDGISISGAALPASGSTSQVESVGNAIAFSRNFQIDPFVRLQKQPECKNCLSGMLGWSNPSPRFRSSLVPGFSQRPFVTAAVFPHCD